MTEAPKELYFYDDWLAQHTKGKLLCGNNKYLHENHVADLLKAERKKALREAAHYHHHFLRDKTDLSIGKIFRSGEAILALISEDKTDG